MGVCVWVADREQLLSLRSHLQTVPQEHHRQGRSQHQEGALCSPSVGSVLLGVPLTELCPINVHIGGTGNKWQRKAGPSGLHNSAKHVTQKYKSIIKNVYI